MTARIYYYAIEADQPFGGIAVIYEHVEVLRNAGYDAWILHDRQGYVLNWLNKEDVPIRYLSEDSTFDSDDIVVIPSVCKSIIRSLENAAFRRFVICQNQFVAAADIAMIDAWRHLGISEVIVTQTKVSEFFKLAGWSDISLIPCGIDRTKFKPSQKKLQIAYMPRKMPFEAAAIMSYFKLFYPNLSWIPFIKLDNMHHDQVAVELGESDIFLALGHLESLGLPALEAMASGCLVAGFHGDGDLSLSEARNSALWVDNIYAAAKALGTLVTWILSGNPKVDIQRKAGARLAESYSLSARDKALLEFWRTRASGALKNSRRACIDPLHHISQSTLSDNKI